MNNNEFDHLIPKITKELTNNFLEILTKYPEFRGDSVDTSPLLNMTVGVFVGSLINILDKIKELTEGEPQLIENIGLTKNSIIKAIENLSFVKKVEFF